MISTAEYIVSNRPDFARDIISRYGMRPRSKKEEIIMLHKLMMVGDIEILKQIAEHHPDIELMAVLKQDEPEKETTAATAPPVTPMSFSSADAAEKPAPAAPAVKQDNNLGLIAVAAFGIIAILIAAK